MMKNRPSARQGISWAIVAVYLALFLALAGCDDDDSDSSLITTPTTTATLGSSVKNVQLTSGQPAEIAFTYTLPGDITSRGDFTVDLTGTLSNVTLSSAPIASTRHRLLETLRFLAAMMIKDAFALNETQVSVFVSYAGDADVCSSAYRFGPYTLSGAIGAAVTSSTTTVTPTQPVVDIINTGSMEICIVTTPSISAYLTVTGVEIDLADCADPTVSIADTSWSGTYSCDNFGVGDDVGQPVNLSITQNPDGSYRYIDDGGAQYDGYLCGDKFKFNGGLSGAYTESGTLVFDSATTATKTSVWNSIPPGISGGNCIDDLQKM